MPPDLVRRAIRRFEYINLATEINDLNTPPSSRLYTLKGDREGQYSISMALGVSRQTIHELLKVQRAVTPLMALRLARLLGNSPKFWLNAQQASDLWESEQAYLEELVRIQPLYA
jgi:addiction module HigA family antidote